MRINWPNFPRCQISGEGGGFRISDVGVFPPGYMPRIITVYSTDLEVCLVGGYDDWHVVL